MKKLIIYGISAAALLLGACSKVTEMDAPEAVQVVYPDGLAFRASISALTKASFTGDNSGQLIWDGDEDVAILAVPVLDTRGMSFDDFHEYDIDHVVSGFASVEVDPSDPSMAILHTAKTAEAWIGNATRVQFFAVYPANGRIPSLDYTEERDGRLLLKVLKDIPSEQNGVNYQSALGMAGCTAAYYVENGTFVSAATGGTEVDPQFLGFSPGNAVLSFKILNSTPDDLPIASVKISSVQLDEYVPTSWPDWSPKDMALSGTTSFLLFDSTDKYDNPELDMIVDAFDPNGDFAYLNNYVTLTFPEAVTVPAGSTTSQYYYAAVCGTGEFKRYEMPGFLRFEALDAEGNVLAVCERAYPTYWLDDDKLEYSLGIDSGIRYNFTVAFGEDSDYHFVVSSQPDEAGSWGENTVEGFVRSYKVVDGTPSYVEWDYDGVFSDPACTQAVSQEEWETWLKTWTKDSPATGESATGKYKAYVTVKANPNPWVPQTYDCTAEVKNALSGAAAKGSSSEYYNLSNASGAATIQNTANCYVIDGPGYYMFPCVLGNGIKDSQPNPGAWTATDNPDASHGLSMLFDYTGNDITSPYVHNSSSAAGTPTSAILLWEDVQGLIETSDNTLTLEADANGVYWIKFHIGASAIDQGNAVLAVKDENGIIMWSWHIWVTDHRFDGTDDMAVDGVNFSKVNLGWVEKERISSLKRTGNMVYLRIKQRESEKTAVIKVFQWDDEETWYAGMPANGYNPLYQFGRKDPIIPGIPATSMSAGTNVPVYGSVTSLSVEKYNQSQTSSTTVPHHYAIRNPHKLIFTEIDWDKERYSWSYDIIFNSWNVLSGNQKDINEINEPQRKSVYDPCPVGYQVPQAYDFRRFYLDNEVTEYDAENDKDRLLGYAYDPDNRVVRSFSVKGMYLYTESYGSNLLFFPLCGARTWHGNGVLQLVIDKGPLYWAALGIGNNQEDVNTGAEWLGLFLGGSEVDDHSDWDFTKTDIPFVFSDGFGPQGSAGFIRPVIDRSTTFTPSTPTPVFGGGNGAGSYTDVNW